MGNEWKSKRMYFRVNDKETSLEFAPQFKGDHHLSSESYKTLHNRFKKFQKRVCEEAYPEMKIPDGERYEKLLEAIHVLPALLHPGKKSQWAPLSSGMAMDYFQGK